MLSELLKQIDSYVKGLSSVQQLEDWIVGNLQPILNTKDDVAIDIANKIDADLVQFGEGIFDEESLKNRLQSYSLIATTGVSISVVVSAGPSTTVTAGDFVSIDLSYPYKPIVVAR